jgi:hypothetical protein
MTGRTDSHQTHVEPDGRGEAILISRWPVSLLQVPVASLERETQGGEVPIPLGIQLAFFGLVC